MTQATLTEQDMIDNLYIMAEELQLQAMAINRQKLAQVHVGLHGHTETIDLRVFPCGSSWRNSDRAPEPLASVDLDLNHTDGLPMEDKIGYYQAGIEKAQAFSQYLDEILETNRPLVAR